MKQPTYVAHGAISIQSNVKVDKAFVFNILYWALYKLYEYYFVIVTLCKNIYMMLCAFVSLPFDTGGGNEFILIGNRVA